MAKKPKISWVIRMRVERDITVYVDARDEEEARAKAAEWNIEGDEEPGDTINWDIKSVEINA